MELAGIWRRHFTLRYVPITMIQVISAAATIFVVAAVQAVSGPRIAHGALETAEKSAGFAIQYLREVGESFASATNVADILQNLIHQQVQTRKARRSPGSSSPSAAANHRMIECWLPSSNSVLPAGGLAGAAASAGSGDGGGGNLNVVNPASSWTDINHLIGQPLAEMYPPHVQHPMGPHSNAQYSTLAGALETPLSYHQPFGDGLGDSLYLPAGVTLPGMSAGSFVKSESAVAGDPLMMFRLPQQAFYAYQMGVPAGHHPRQ